MARTTRAWLTPDAETGAAICRPLFIPPDFLTSVTGALEELAFPWNWEEWGDQTPEECADIMRTMLDTFYEGCAVTYSPRYYRLTPAYMNKSVGGSDAWLAVTNQWQSGVWRQSTPAINDQWDISLPLGAGSYQIGYFGQKTSSSGQIKALVNGVNKGVIDTYDAVGIKNYQATFGPFTLADDEVIDLSIVVYGKNASSGGYRADITEIVIY